MTDADHVDVQKLGEAIAELQDAQLAERNDLARVRSRLLSPPLRRGISWRWALAPAVLVALALGWVAFLREPQALTVAVGGAAVEAGGWVAADAEAQQIEFSDGSEIRLEPSSGVRVAELDANGAALDLQRGSMHVRVVHRDDDTRWRVAAGPFTVEVVGTAFDVAWDPAQQRFGLHLEEGSVRVAGPTVEERIVEVGETLSVEVERQRVQVVLQVPEHEETSRVVEVPEVEIEARPQAHRPQKLHIDWRELARQARHREAVAAANWDRELATATAQDLLLLGDSARLGGAPAKANIAYLGVRERFTSTPEAAQAAFLLGRLAMRTGDPGSGAAWFERSIAEDTDGPYAMVARGRLIDAYRRAGNEVAARRAALDYLDTHPSGPHANLARSLQLEGSTE